MLFLIALIFVAAGFITLWPRYFANASLTFTLSTLAALVLIGLFAGIALTLMLDPNASAGGRP
jgi:uncharacterized membrane-anchored protein YitT (DUF2179 family)